MLREEPDERLHWLMPREKKPRMRPDACARCYISLPLLRGFTCHIAGCPGRSRSFVQPAARSRRPLIEAWASHKNFQRKDDTALNLAKDGGRALKAASRETIRQD